MRLASLALLLSLPLAAQVTVETQSGRIAVAINGKPFTELWMSSADPKPFLHPLRTADGIQVTRSFPMEVKEGEERDHPHHRGLWFTHGAVNGINFWENEKGYQTKNRGTIVTKKINEAESGKKEGVVGATFDWLDPQGNLMLTEYQRIVFHAQPLDKRIMDFTITLTPKVPVTFEDTKEGTFAIRLATPLNEKHGGTMENAEGAKGEANVWGKRSPWVDYYGTVEGKQVGIAIMDHPGNQGFPTYWHSRAYGLFAANRYGVHDFENDKSKSGAVTYPPGVPVTFRYRVVIHNGGPQEGNIAKLYQEFAKSKK